MKKFIIIMLLLSSCQPKVYKDRYEIRQSLKYVQGGDSITTRVFYFPRSSFIGEGIFKKGNTVDFKYKDSLEAVDFIERHKEFN